MEGATIYSSERTRETHGILAGIGAGLVSVLFFFVSEGWGGKRINAIRDSGLVGEAGSVRIGWWLVTFMITMTCSRGKVNKERCVVRVNW